MSNARKLKSRTRPLDALILVDLQNDFMPRGALAVPEGDRAVPVANRLMSRFELVIATADWHPPDHCSFAGNHPGRKVGEIVRVGELDQILWPEHCVQNTRGAASSITSRPPLGTC